MSPIRKLRAFASAKRGMAALEFAILAPMMVFLLFGSFDLLDMVQANRRVQNTAASLADVVARDTEVSNAEMNGLWAAIDILMFPDSGAGMQVRITAVQVESSSSARVVWSDGHNGLAALTPGTPYTLDGDMMRPGTSIIVADTVYTYRAPLRFLLTGNTTLRHTAFRRARLVDPIPRVA